MPRFRLRTLMITVAIFGALLAIGIEASRLAHLAEDHRRRVKLCILEEENWLSSLKRLETLLNTVETQLQTADVDDAQKLRQVIVDLRKEADELKPRLKKATALRLKYERAASRPWETVTPDEP